MKKAQSGTLMSDRMEMAAAAPTELAFQRLAMKPKAAHMQPESAKRRSPRQAPSRAGAPAKASKEKRTSPATVSASAPSSPQAGRSRSQMSESSVAVIGVSAGPMTALWKAGAKATPPTSARLNGAPARIASVTARPQPSGPTGKFGALAANGKSTRPAARKRSTVTSAAVKPSATEIFDTIGWMPQIRAQSAPKPRPFQERGPMARASGALEVGSQASEEAEAVALLTRAARV